jgi:hypothetical protein
MSNNTTTESLINNSINSNAESNSAANPVAIEGSSPPKASNGPETKLT